MFDLVKFGMRLHMARMHAGLSMTEVANRLYISQSVVSRYESGKIAPPIDRVVEMANLYGCSLNWLCGRGVKK